MRLDTKDRYNRILKYLTMTDCYYHSVIYIKYLEVRQTFSMESKINDSLLCNNR